jgi:hypothetical protein
MDLRRVRSLSNQRQQRQRFNSELAGRATSSADADLCRSADEHGEDMLPTQPQMLLGKNEKGQEQYSVRRLSFTASPPAYRRGQPRTNGMRPLVATIAEARRNMIKRLQNSGELQPLQGKNVIS